METLVIASFNLQARDMFCCVSIPTVGVVMYMQGLAITPLCLGKLEMMRSPVCTFRLDFRSNISRIQTMEGGLEHLAVQGILSISIWVAIMMLYHRLSLEAGDVRTKHEWMKRPNQDG